MSWGLTDLTGTAAYNGAFAQSLLLFTDQHVPVAGKRVIGYRLYCQDPAVPENFTMKFCLHDVTDANYANSTPVAGTEATVLMPLTLGWVEVLLPEPFTYDPAKKYGRWMGAGQSGTNGNIYRIGATAYGRNKAVDFNLTPEAVYGSGSENFPHNVAFEVLEDDAPSGAAVNPTGTDLALTVGTPAEIVMQGMGGATATALTLRYTSGELVVNTVQADFDYTADDADTGTISFTPTVGNLPYGSTGYQYVITLSAGDPVLSAVTSLAPVTGNVLVIADSPVNNVTSVLNDWIVGEAVTGDQIDYPTSTVSEGVPVEITIRPNFTHVYVIDEEDEWPSSITYTLNYWDSVTQTRYAVSRTVNFSEGGEPLPDELTPFSFTPRFSAPLSTQYTSNEVTIEGISTSIVISIVGGEYSINSGAFTSSNGSVVEGDVVVVRVTSSSEYLTAVTATLTVGDYSTNYSVTTRKEFVEGGGVRRGIGIGI